MKTCKDIMTRDAKCLAPSDTVQMAAVKMKDEDIGSILVCEPEKGVLLGIVTDRDIVLKIVAQGLAASTILETIMTLSPVCCREGEDVEKAMKLMADHKVRRLPVIDQEGRLLGIVSQGDMATRAQEPEKTAEMIEEVSRPISGNPPP